MIFVGTLFIALELVAARRDRPLARRQPLQSLPPSRLFRVGGGGGGRQGRQKTGTSGREKGRQ